MQRGDSATISYIAEWEADVYGLQGTWQMASISGYTKRNGVWLWTSAPRPNGKSGGE